MLLRPQGKSTRLITERSLGSNSAPRTNLSQMFRLVLAEDLLCAHGVYNRRWYWQTPCFSIRLHHWMHSDDERNMHDHPWWFITFILRGGYTDVSPAGREELTAGQLAFRPALHRHYVKVHKGGCWSLLLTGPVRRKFGFWVGEKWKKANKYFLQHGKHVCD